MMIIDSSIQKHFSAGTSESGSNGGAKAALVLTVLGLGLSFQMCWTGQ